LSNPHVQPLLPSPSHGPATLSLQPCLSPMQSMVPGISLPEYASLPQPIFTPDMHHSSNTNSPMNHSIVMPASPNTAGVFDMNTKWYHLFQGGWMLDVSSIYCLVDE